MPSDPHYTFVIIPRARRVHQSLLTTPFSAALSLIAAVWHITAGPLVVGPPVPEVLILNGPGTCFVLCVATYLNRVRCSSLSLECSLLTDRDILHSSSLA